MICQKCTKCGFSIRYPNKRTYITCPCCTQVTKWHTLEQYNKAISKHTYVPVVDDSVVCKCGCGQRGTVFATIQGNKMIRRYIHGHNSKGKGNHFYGKLGIIRNPNVIKTGSLHPKFKDMTNRQCSICHSNKTSILDLSSKNRPHWRYTTNGLLICSSCYRRSDTNKRIQKRWYQTHKKQIRERYRKKHNVPPERYRV